MTSRERVIRALEFSGPVRVPVDFPEPVFTDVVGAPWDQRKGEEWQDGEMLKHYDEWGNLWARFPTTQIGEPKVGALSDWDDLDTWQPPDLTNPERYSEARAKFVSAGDKFKTGFIGGFPFAHMRYLRGIDNFLADVLLYPEKINLLAERVMPVLEGVMDRFSEIGADAIFFCEDWGTQERLLVHPDKWVEMFKPMFVRLVDHAHGRGMRVFMHSCGWIWDIIPHLIECGVDVLQLDQPTLMGLDRLAGEFGGRIAFQAPVDIQRTLQSHDPEVIRQGARELIDKLGSFNGGFIAGCYGDPEGIGVDPTMQSIACEEFLEYGKSRYT